MGLQSAADDTGGQRWVPETAAQNATLNDPFWQSWRTKTTGGLCVAKYDFFLFCESRTFVYYITKCVVFENIVTPDLNPE